MNNSCYVLDCYNQAIKLFKKFFSDSDEIIFVVNTYKDEGFFHRPRRIKSYLKNQKLNKNLNCLESDCLDGMFGKYTHYYLRCKVRDVDYKKLILHLCQHEMGYDIKPMNDYYLIHLEKNYCFRMLDDRCVDLIFKNSDDKINFLHSFSEFK